MYDIYSERKKTYVRIERVFWRTMLILIKRAISRRSGVARWIWKIFNNRASDCEERATRNETDTSLRNEHNIGLRYRRMHFGLAIRCPPPARYKEFVYPVYTCARGQPLSVDSSTTFDECREKREWRDKLNLRRDLEPHQTNKYNCV